MTRFRDSLGMNLTTRLKWVVWWRVVFLAALLGSAVSLDLLFDSILSQELYWIGGIGFLLSLPVGVFLQSPLVRGRENLLAPLAWAQIILDCALVTGFVSITGGQASAFTILYGLSMVIGSILLFSKGALVSALLSAAGILLVGLLSSESQGWDVNSVVRLIFLSSSFLLVGALISILFRNREYLAKSLRKKSADLEGLVELQAAMVENIPSGILLIDSEGWIVYANQLADFILCESLIGKNIDESSFSISGKPAEWEADYPLKNSSSKKLRCRVIDFSQDQRLLVFEDITEIKKLQENLQLKDRLAGIGKLAAGLAHEIKNPLASLSGSVQLLNQELQLDESQQKLMKIVHRETDRLDALLQNFLDYAKPSIPRHQKIDLSTLIQEVIELLDHSELVKSKATKLEFISEPPIFVDCDPHRMKQVFLNLIKNSCEAVGKGGEVKVSIQKREDHIECRVQDNGKGMNEETQQRLFEPFYSGREGGTGLGMSLVYQLLLSHSSELHFKSEVGKGTEFWFEIPIKFQSENFKNKERAA